MAPDLVVVGHVTKDLVEGGVRAGGTATYACLTAAKLGLTVALLTSASPDLDISPLCENIEIELVPSPVTTVFENIYTPVGRDQYIRSAASSLEPSHIPLSWLNAPLVLLGPVAGEVEPKMIQAFHQAVVGISAQGWMRRWGEDGRVYPTPWQEAPLFLSSIDVLFFSHEDASGDEALIEGYAAQVPLLVVTQGDRGARVHWRGSWNDSPAFPAKVTDITGAGDVFAAAYLIHYYEHKDPLEAACFANCAASLAVEGQGVEGIPTRKQIEERMGEKGLNPNLL
ncbi:MAG: PfkB family carbohydrate kinase [Dehalococcoidia bacterium]